MIAYRARQHAPLDVAALADQIVGRIAMADTLDVLIDDRALIEVAGDVMGGSANQLDAALMRLMIRPRTLETRQKRVMDVDAAPRKLRRHLVRKDLHVMRQHHQVGFCPPDQVPYRSLLLALGLLGDRQIMKWNVPEIQIAVGL